MSQNEQNVSEELQQALLPMQQQIRRLTVRVMILTMILTLTVISVFGSLVNYFDGDASLFGGATVGAAFIGFAFGWAARRLVAGS